ncbi:MAG: penicillin-binding protein 1C [Robiginitomaculum sp.]|nr:penicillin-binding protein 1C [Robiginitomaculum sp.]
MKNGGRIRRIKRFILTFIGTLLLANIIFPPPLNRAYDTSTLVTDRNGQWLTAFTVGDGRWRLKADMDEVDPRFIEALIAIEDKRFYSHSGVDPLAILRAARSWRKYGKAVSGASTITMQLARQLEPRPRTLKSKIIESLRAVQLELRLSKREILSLYLTHTPYGGNIEGITAAAHVYFDKRPDQLTDGEIALLIALPQAPEARRPDRQAKTAQTARDEVLDKLVRAGLISPRQAQEAKQDDVASMRKTFPQDAWLAARKIRRDENIKREQARMVSSLDADFQANIERLAAQFTDNLESNVAVLVVDNQTMKVRAHIGSAGRDRPGGWIDMTGRVRSPGSTLKPFIYGFAFDDGLSAPGSFILDAPTRFGSYQPENFNRRYHGDVRVFEALAHSLNVPAVLALDKVGTKRFEAALQMTGSELVIPNRGDGQAGLAMALGGLGLKAQDLAVLYAALANGGKAQNLVWMEDGKPDASYQMLTKTSAKQITKILRQAPLPGGRVPHWLAKDSQPIAYKTGTSYGFRDAWAAGYTDEWTVIVWAGRPDGSTRVGKTGRIAAAPLLFDVFSVLPNTQGFVPYTRVANAPRGVRNFGGKPDVEPVLLFPPDGAEIAVPGFGPNANGLTLTARSPSQSELIWYVDGIKLDPISLNGQTVWQPVKPGFYIVSVVDEGGATTSANVRVMSLN